MEDSKLDSEFSKFLHIFSTCINTVEEKDIIDVCEIWISKLVEPYNTIQDKIIRNKYICELCYQLARGILCSPFLELPQDKLPPYEDVNISEDISNYNSNFKNVFEGKSHNLESESVLNNIDYISKTDGTSRYNMRYDIFVEDNIPESSNSCLNMFHERLEKLRQNIVNLKYENLYLKNRIGIENSLEINQIEILKNSVHIKVHEDLQYKFKELQEMNKRLQDTVEQLSSQKNIDDQKMKPFGDSEPNHDIEKNAVESMKNNLKKQFEQQFEELKQTCDNKIKEILNEKDKELSDILKVKNNDIKQKDDIIETNNIIITRMKTELNSLKLNMQLIANKLCEERTQRTVSKEKLKIKEIDKRVKRLEKQKLLNIDVDDSETQFIRHTAKVSRQVTSNKSKSKVHTEYSGVLRNGQLKAMQQLLKDKLYLESILKATYVENNELHNNYVS